MSNEEAFERLVNNIASQAPSLLELMRAAEFEVVSTSVKNNIAYVVYELTLDIEGREISQDSVQNLMLSGQDWLLLLPTTAEASIANIDAKFN
jgi:hypothetical protein